MKHNTVEKFFLWYHPLGNWDTQLDNVKKAYRKSYTDKKGITQDYPNYDAWLDSMLKPKQAVKKQWTGKTINE